MPVKGGYIGRQDVRTSRGGKGEDLRVGRAHQQAEPYKQKQRKVRRLKARKRWQAERTGRK